ncbi:hypothetical protein [Clostridium sp. YIM B02500]|uniref:hypothetical protein n=1 Tax=Clostridium sp. YIM B02500 TaxID=2910681 RepID=UPI001EEDA04A|nr:hypothetical protein [Clostridium sp. YIM B02500]
MSNVFYGEKSISDLDKYYGISDESVKKTGFYDTKLKESKKIQSAFNNHCVHLTLRECGDMYEAWSDERYCAGWEGGLEEMTEEEIFDMLFGWLNTFIRDRIGRLEVLCNEMKPLMDKK